MLQNKCFNVVRKELVAELRIDDLFDNGVFVAEEDCKLLLKLVQDGSQVQKTAASAILAQVLKKLPQDSGVKAAFLEQISDLYTQPKSKILRSFMQQLVAQPEQASFLVAHVLGKVKKVDDDFHLMEQAVDLTKMAKIPGMQALKKEVSAIVKSAAAFEHQKTAFKALYLMLDLIKLVGNDEALAKEIEQLAADAKQAELRAVLAKGK